MMTETKIDPETDFKESVADFLHRIRCIDNATPWSENPPKWWLKMSEMECAIYKIMNEEE